MKTFKQLREAFKTDDPEAVALKPKAKGEQEFVDNHDVKDTEYPEKNTDKIVNARIQKQGEHQRDNGDRDVVHQGTSKLSDKSGFKGKKTPLTRADKNHGDLAPVRGPSSTSPFNEDILNHINEDSIIVSLSDDTEIEINQMTLDMIMEVYSNLNTDNQAIFYQKITESQQAFEKILTFVVNNIDVEK